MSEPSDQAHALPSVPALLFGVSEALAPFVAAWHALPVDLRADTERNLADVRGVFPPPAPLTIGALAELVCAYAVVTPGAEDALAVPPEAAATERRCRVCLLTDI